MEARILDTENVEGCKTGTLYADWPHPSYELELNTIEWPDRFGHIRAQDVVDACNKDVGRMRFKVVRVVPSIGSTVRFHAFGAYRGGRVVDHKVGRLHVSVQVAWQNKRGGTHLRWYSTINLHAAGTPQAVFVQDVSTLSN